MKQKFGELTPGRSTCFIARCRGIHRESDMNDQTIRPPTAEETAEIKAKRTLGLNRLGVEKKAGPAEIAEAADAFVDSEQIERSKYFKGFYLLVFKPARKIIEEVGVAWGEQLVRAFGWQWQCVVREEEFEPAVTSPDQAFVVFPHRYLGRMLEPPYDDVTLMLMFNMIQGKKLPEVAAGALEDISDGRLRHIVPRR
jgi:hypothetical protein